MRAQDDENDAFAQSLRAADRLIGELLRVAPAARDSYIRAFTPDGLRGDFVAAFAVVHVYRRRLRSIDSPVELMLRLIEEIEQATPDTE